MKPNKETIKSAVIDRLKNIYDPEIPVNIYDLGLVYKVEVDDSLKVFVEMTLTAPNCPVADSLPIEVRSNILMIEGVSDAQVDITFDPPWTMDMMSEEAKLELGFL
ncbi:MAG: SUF system Fe-S cluster assembly protein [Bacteroidales bacterium]|nr:SUF system Fe-S cluster assembly protein [Bacteroidales bacterium]